MVAPAGAASVSADLVIAYGSRVARTGHLLELVGLDLAIDEALTARAEEAPDVARGFILVAG